MKNVSKDPLKDQLRVLDYLIFDVLIGNTDNHIKNLSLLYSPDLKTVSLAPAYDKLSTVIYREGTLDMSIAIAGEKISRASAETTMSASRFVKRCTSVILR